MDKAFFSDLEHAKLQNVSKFQMLPECQGTPCSEQVQYLKCKWLQLDWNPQPLKSSMSTQLFSWMIELCFEYLFVWCIWLCVLIMSHMHFRVNLHSVVAWMPRNSLLETCAISEVQVITTGYKPTTTYSHSHLNFEYCTCFKQGVPCHSCNNRVRIHSKHAYDMVKTHSQKCTIQINKT